MSHEDHTDVWEPKGAEHTFKGYDVRDHGVWATDLNHGEVDGEVDLSDDE
jgi:hypothetical protein